MTAGSQSDLLPASQVAELITGLGKALRAFHMYLPNNPIYQRATDNLRAAFAPIWAVLEELVLTVAETDFVWEEQVVYHQLNKSESLAWGLFKDGMRSLTIKRGAEQDELPRFLEMINRARYLSADAGDDQAAIRPVAMSTVVPMRPITTRARCRVVRIALSFRRVRAGARSGNDLAGPPGRGWWCAQER